MTLTAAFLLLIAFASVAAVVAVALECRRKNMHLWLWTYLRRRAPARPAGPVHIMFCFVDHFEPQWGRPDYDVEVGRVSRWREGYRALASRHRDADGVHPQHTFFYPEEEYREEHLDQIAALCREGFGEIEVHLHHDNDTEAGLREKIGRFVQVLHERHGALPVDPATGRPAFGFIHGNWCLDNSRGDGRWCGVNNELRVLGELGCYADFTLPSAPSDTQTRKVNAIYYATDDCERPKSHDDGADAQVGRPGSGDLLIVQGPLALNWKNRRWGIMPRIENADVRAGYPPTGDRVDLWIKQHVHVAGRPEWVFVKVHTHGTQDRDIDALLGEPVEAMFNHLENRYNDGRNYVLHYVNSREMFNIIKAAEAGRTGNPHAFRDFRLPRPPMFGPGRVGEPGSGAARGL
ncbi:MAG TPA: hypothetical protein PL196_01165 [Burkholderiaceae bacterium]|nr:hypothetical protein [Burkholderiaceae bacterium]